MPEPMTDERLAEIRAEYEAFGGPAEMAEVLAEVERLRAEVKATPKRWTKHADKQSQALRKAEAELTEARTAGPGAAAGS